jgi:hypothetical protein
MTAAKTFRAPAGKGMLYVYKEKEFRAMLAPRPIWIDGQHLVSNTNGTFVSIPLKPGNYKIQAAAQALIDDERHKKAYPAIHLRVAAGKSYFVRQWVGGNILTSADGSDGPDFGSGLPPFESALVDEQTGRAACQTLEHVGAEPFEEN